MPLTYAIDTPPAHGTLGAPVGDTVLYTPTTGYTGLDGFTWHANDGTDDSNIATVTLNVGFPFPTPGDTALGSTGWRHTGVVLDPYVGPDTITVDGTVIDSKDVPGRLTIAADGVTIKRSLLHAPPDGSAIYLNPGPDGLLLEDVEVMSQSSTPSLHGDWAIWLTDGGTDETHAVVRRAYIHGTASGVLGSGHFTVEDSWIGDNVNLGTQHTTPVGAFGGDHFCVVRHNNLKGLPDTHSSSACEFANTFATSSGILVEGNLLNSAGDYSTYFNTGSDDPFPRNFDVHVVDNFFGIEFWPDGGRIWVTTGWADAPSNEWTNNRWWAPGDAKHLTLVVP